MIAPAAAGASVRDGRGAPGLDGGPAWQWPVNVAAYDRSPSLSRQEARALAVLDDDLREWLRCRRHRWAWRALDRLVRPLADGRAVLTEPTRRQGRCADVAVAAILRQCAREQAAFWGWSTTIWTTQREFCAAHPAWIDRQVRHYLIALPCLLHCLTDLRPLGNYKRVLLAEKVFGPALVQAFIGRVAGVLVGWGYQNASTGRAFPRVLCETLLHNRSPRLEDVTPALLEDLRRTARG